MRQITASVTFLPLLSEPTCFDILVYADQEVAVPVSWEDTDPCYIENAEDVKLRSFSTKVNIFICAHISNHFTSYKYVL
jgi:mitotic spindle assembly checkpoint protein MAD2